MTEERAAREAAKLERERVAEVARNYIECLKMIVDHFRFMRLQHIVSCKKVAGVRDRVVDSKDPNKYQFPLALILKRTKLIKEEWNLKQHLDAQINELPLSHASRSEVRKEQGILDKELVLYRAALIKHVKFVGKRCEIPFLAVDYLSDPSSLPFTWAQEEWMVYMMTSRHNKEHRRARREANDAVAMEPMIGNMTKCAWQNKKAGHLNTLKLADACRYVQRAKIGEILHLRTKFLDHRKTYSRLTESQQHKQIRLLNTLLKRLPHHLQQVNAALTAVRVARGRARCNHCLDQINEYVMHTDFLLERLKLIIHHFVMEGLGSGLKRLVAVDYTITAGFALTII